MLEYAASVRFKIFISYRRDDTAGYARAIFDRLNAKFPGSIFMDISGINPGMDFVEIIENAVGKCEVLVALIGKRWLAPVASGERRIDDQKDFVRLEISAAINRSIYILPLLLRGAEMPAAEELPEEIRPFARIQALEISDVNFEHDIERLSEAIERVVKNETVGRSFGFGWRKTRILPIIIGLAIAGIATIAGFWVFRLGQDPPVPVVGAPAKDRVGFPKDYQSKFEVLSRSLDQDSFDITTIYGNAAAASVAEPSQLPYPYGSVFVMETANVLRGDNGVPQRDGAGLMRKGEVVGLHVMRKEPGFGRAYEHNRSGEWEYVEYRSDGSYIVPPEKSAFCAECHQKNAAERDFIMSGRFSGQEEEFHQ